MDRDWNLTSELSERNSGASPHGEAAYGSLGRKPWVGYIKILEPRRKEGWHIAQASIYCFAFPSSGFRLRFLRSYAVTGCHPTSRWGSLCFLYLPTGFVRVAYSTRGYFMPPRHAARLLNSARLMARNAPTRNA